MAALIGLCAGTVQAEEFVVRNAATRLVDQVYLLDAQIEYSFNERALAALENGVPLTLRMDIRIERHRKYWMDAAVAELEQRFQIQYHALSGLYVLRNLNSGANEVYPTLDSALAALGMIRGLPLLDDNLLDQDAAYEVSLRVHLEIESLPSPLRPLAYVTPAWWLSSDWYRWSLEP